jgi:DNA-binding CsgD family transcriptional regulator
MAAEAAYSQGLIRLASTDHDGAIEHLRRSVEVFEGLSMPFHSARSRLELAAALEASDPARATDEAEQALGTFDRIGAKRYADRARAVLGRLGVRSRPPRPPSRTDGPLSPRELEVALLVAEGLTNAEIAEQLVVEPGTVANHVADILDRLGFRSRTQIGVWAAERGLGHRPAESERP